MLETTARTRGLSLHSALPSGKFFGNAAEVVASGVAIDAAWVRPGEVFVALTQASQDTHDDADLAIERGAAAVIAERYLPISAPQVIVRDSREALGSLCHELAGHPTQTLNTIAVAGTQGKTVTTLLIASVLGAARQSSGVLSTIGYSDGCEQVEARCTTPAAPEAANWLQRMKIVGCQNAILEVSRLALLERRLAAAQFDAVVLTNLRPSATDDFRSIQNERQLHGGLFSQLKNSGFIVANADDANVQGLLGSLACPVMTYSLRGEGEVTATVLERHASEQTFLLHAGCETMPVRTEMIGDHHVQNCLAAAALGLVLGLDLPTIARGLESQRKMPGRLERLECGQPFSCFIDYAKTPEMLAASLKAVRQVTKGSVWCVLGSEGDMNKELRPQLGRVIERMADQVILTSDNPRAEEPKEIAHQILDGMSDVASPRVMPNRAKAIEWALSQASPGDAVVIAGKGDANEQIIGRKRQRHDDRDIARAFLYGGVQEREFPRLARLD